MILHRLIIHFLKHKDDVEFYRMQAEYTVRWLEKMAGRLDGSVSALDLGCGHGLLGAELSRRGCLVTFADAENYILPEYGDVEFRRIDVEKDDIVALGEYDLVICSNVLEHLADPRPFVENAHRILKPEGRLYLSWGNWLSPWGGHEFSPFHYLGARRGHLVYDRLIGRPRVHTPYTNLFPMSVGGTLKIIRENKNLEMLAAVPRYYPELAFITRIPLLREFLTFNCAILAERAGPASTGTRGT